MSCRISDFNENLYRNISRSDLAADPFSFVQNPLKLSVRNGVSYTMRHFIDIVAGADQATPECEEMFLRVLLPGLKIVLHSENEIVWMEVVGIFLEFF